MSENDDINAQYINSKVREVQSHFEEIRSNISLARDDKNSDARCGKNADMESCPYWSGAAPFVEDRQCNAISIMAKRGDGKTTILRRSINEMLKKKANGQYPKDIILEPILPERFSKSDNLIGWILASLQNLVEQLNNSLSKWNNPDSKIKNLSILYNEIRTAAMQFMRLDIPNEDNFEYERERWELYSQGYQFRSKWIQFVDELLDRYSEMVNAKESLLIIPIDDADLTPDRVLPLLSQMYLTLANYHTVFLLAGDENTFYHTMRKDISMDLANLPTAYTGSITTNSINIIPDTVLDIHGLRFIEYREQLASRLLAKYLPKNYRVYLPRFSRYQALSFIPLSENHNGTSRKNMAELLERFKFHQKSQHHSAI